MADPTALQTATAAAHAVQYVGLPEVAARPRPGGDPPGHRARSPTRSSPRSARRWPTSAPDTAVRCPRICAMRTTRASQGLGHGTGYKYPHDDPRGVVAATVRPGEARRPGVLPSYGPWRGARCGGTIAETAAYRAGDHRASSRTCDRRRDQHGGGAAPVTSGRDEAKKRRGRGKAEEGPSDEDLGWLAELPQRPRRRGRLQQPSGRTPPARATATCWTGRRRTRRRRADPPRPADADPVLARPARVPVGRHPPPPAVAARRSPAVAVGRPAAGRRRARGAGGAGERDVAVAGRPAAGR